MVNMSRDSILGKVGPCVGVCREMVLILVPTLLMLALIVWLTLMFVG